MARAARHEPSGKATTWSMLLQSREGALASCFSMGAEYAQTKAGSIGRPNAFVAARVVDDSGHDLPAGQAGELLLKGPAMCSGYFEDPEATRSAIDAQGWFHTGDIAKIDEDGFFFIVDRTAYRPGQTLHFDRSVAASAISLFIGSAWRALAAAANCLYASAELAISVGATRSTSWSTSQGPTMP